MDGKRKAVVERIRFIEGAIDRAREYLETGKHADWFGFRALFTAKARAGKELPPHKDWVKNVYVPRQKKALLRAEKILERLH